MSTATIRRSAAPAISRLRASWSTWGALFLLIALACQPLLEGPPRGHDALLHYYRIPAVSALWQNGIPFARWLPDLVYGYGSPLFNFYPPLSAYLLTALYWLVGQNGPLAYSLAYAVALALTAISMFLLARGLFGERAGLFAAVAYTLSPHVLLQTYSRGSLSNALALAFAPLAAHALLLVARRAGPRRVAFAAVAVALVLLSHAAAGLLFVPVLLFMGLSAARLLHRAPLAPVLVALLLGLALAAFAWLPGLAEIGLTRYAHSVSGGGAEFREHFAAALFWPPQTIARLAKIPLPHSVGLLQLLQGASAMLVAAVLAWRARPDARGARQTAGGAAFLVACGLLALAILFFATPPSTWFWANIAPLRQLQFPWRLLDAPALLLALAAAWFWRDGASLHPRRRPWLLALSLALIFLNALPVLYPARMTALPRQPTLAAVTRVQQERGIVGLTAWGEYSSDQVQQFPGKPPFAGADRAAPLVQKLRLPQDAMLRAARGGLLFASWDLFLPAPAVVDLSVHYFPGWRAAVDGASAAIGTDAQGRMRVSLPAGLHRLTLDWTRTPIRWLADGLSLFALVVAVALLWTGRQQAADRRPQTTDGPLRISNPQSLISSLQSPVSSLQSPIPNLQSLLLLLLLLLAKTTLFDHLNTPFLIHPAPDHIPGIARPAHGDFGPVRLTAYEQNESGELVLYWRADEVVARDYTARLSISGADGALLQEIDNPYPGDNPTSTWRDGLLVRDPYRLPLPAAEPPAVTYFSVALLDPDSGEPLAVLDGPEGATTVGVGHVKQPPPPVEILAPTVEATFTVDQDPAITLSHALLPQSVSRNAATGLTLYWRSEAPVAADYTVYLHLLRPDGEFVAAFDAPPLDGRYPTSFWSPGEQIVDARELRLDVPPGDYLLRAGLYDPASEQRLPLAAPHEGADGLVLGTVRVLP